MPPRALNFRNRPERPAFALIIAMTLMGFVMLILLGLTALIHVESQILENNRNLSVARNNALLGMEVALGQLQMALGPDQRVTGTGALDGNPDSGQSRWTGVWRTDIESSDYTDEPTWLVSKTGGLPSGALSNSKISSAEQLPMTRAQTDPVTGNTLDAVVVGKVPLPEGGAYAFWVSDEGVKARVNLGRENTTDPVALRQHSQTPQRFGVEAITQLNGNAFLNQPSIEKVTALSELNVAGSGSITSEDIYELSPDLTTHSFSVLSDVRKGGLRKDLSAGLAAGAPEPSGQIFGPQMSATATAADPGGPEWEQLRSYYNLRPDTNGEVVVREQLDDRMGIYPVMTAMQLYLFVSYTMNNGKPDVVCHFMPAVVLWNPYSVPLKADDYVIHVSELSWIENFSPAPADPDTGYNAGNMFYGGLLNNRISPKIGNDAQGNEIFDKSNTGTAWFPGWRFLSFEIQNTAFAPGEAKVFSPPAWTTHVERGGTGNNSTENDPNVLEEGFRLGASFYWINGGHSLYRDTADGHLLTRVLPTLPTHPDLAWRLGLKASGTIVDSEPLQVALTLNTASQSGVSPPAMDVDLLDLDHPLARSDEFFGYKSVMQFTDNAMPASPYAHPAWLGNLNPRATYSGSSQYDWQSGSSDNTFIATNPSTNPSYLTYTDTIEANIDTNLEAFVGLSESGGTNHAVLFDVPQQETVFASIGQLAHANLSHFYRNPSDSQSAFTKDLFRNARFQSFMPAYAIGNSQANPRIARDTKVQDMSKLKPKFKPTTYNFRGVIYDYAYLLNEALWDSYFFSTVPRGNSFDPATPLPNERMVATPVDSDEKDALQDYDRAASNVMLEGGFNVNSTSVQAWAALLASFFGEPMEKTEGGFTAINSDQAAYPRGQQLWGNHFNPASGDATSNEAYTGYRTLTQEEIQALAEAIVQQVKMRGPFRSIAEFVNRFLDTNPPANWIDDGAHPYEWNTKGVLQAAIDRVSEEAAANGKNLLNAPFYDAYYMGSKTNYSGDQLPFPDAEVTPRVASASGYFTQVDLLYRLGSVLVARSDTFVIRAYGEAQNPITGKPTAGAWCEAVVQRFPEYQNSSADPDPELSATDKNNQRFGRALRIISFRWLNGTSSEPPAPELDS